MKEYKLIILLSLCVIFTMGYIFQNSVQPSNESNKSSETIVKHIKPVIDPDNKTTDKELNERVRKVAHFIEFAVLGIFICLLTNQIAQKIKSKIICFPLLLALATAVTDEFIQSFNDRTSNVRDILIDFGGAVSGMLIVLLIIILTNKLKNIKIEKTG